MMEYLLDTSVFVQAQRRYYQFEVFPGFWEYCIQKFIDGSISTVTQVYEEIQAGDDELAHWMKGNYPRKSLESPQNNVDAIGHYQKMFTWAQSHYMQKGVDITFAADVADPWLCACACLENLTVVTQEVAGGTNYKGGKGVKIPDICKQFDIECIDTFELLKRLKARFVLES